MLDKEAANFHTFGFVLIKSLFSRDELETINKEYAERFEEIAKGFPAAIGVRGQMSWSNMNAACPFLSNALESHRICEVAEQLLGSDALGIMANGNHFSGDYTEWHADTSIPDLHGIKFVAYLDPLTADTGALRVMPGSHSDPFHQHMAAFGAKSSLYDPGNPEAANAKPIDVRSVPGFVCETEPGDVIGFHVRTWHATVGGSAGRRMCSFTYLKNSACQAEEKAARNFFGQLKKEAFFRELRRRRKWKDAGVEESPSKTGTAEPQYAPSWLRNEGASPKRQRCIERMREWGALA